MDDHPENFSREDGDSFELTEWTWSSGEVKKPIVYLAPGLKERGLTEMKIREFRAFNDWWRTLEKSMHGQVETTHEFHDCPYQLRYIRIQAFDAFGKRGDEGIKFMKLFAQIENSKKEWLPGVVFLRGGCVAILMIVRPSDAPLERYVIMTEQARAAAGSLSFLEIPAGMLDNEGEITSAVIREVQEEVNIELRKDELIDMTKLATEGSETNEDLQYAMYPSPGACDEFMSIFFWEKEMDRVEIETLKDKLTGNRAGMERISVRLLEYDKLIETAARDGKTLAAWALYEYLKRVVPERFSEYGRN